MIVHDIYCFLYYQPSLSAIVIGFVQTAYTVNENVGLNNFLICTEVVIGAPLSQSINLQITLFQGNGDAVCKLNCQKCYIRIWYI